MEWCIECVGAPPNRKVWKGADGAQLLWALGRRAQDGNTRVHAAAALVCGRIRRSADVSAAAWGCGRLRAKHALVLLARRGDLSSSAATAALVWAAAEAQVLVVSSTQVF